MKTNPAKPGGFRRLVGRVVSAGALGLLAMSAVGAVGPKSPVGTWDCVLSGSREGVAQLTFTVDGTFTLNEIIVPKASTAPGPDNDSRGSDDTGRVPTGTTTTSTNTVTHTNFFGWASATGSWSFDSRGRVIGFFYETDATSDDTNAPPAMTNQLSFVGTVVPNKHLALRASGQLGKVSFSGVPDVPQADLSGNWYGVQRQGALSVVEFYTMTRLDPSSNFYMVEGTGPAYTLTGLALACPQKKLGMATGLTPVSAADTNSISTLRAVVGPLNLRQYSGPLHGVQGTEGGDETRLRYTAQHQ